MPRSSAQAIGADYGASLPIDAASIFRHYPPEVRSKVPYRERQRGKCAHPYFIANGPKMRALYQSSQFPDGDPQNHNPPKVSLAAAVLANVWPGIANAEAVAIPMLFATATEGDASPTGSAFLLQPERLRTANGLRITPNVARQDSSSRDDTRSACSTVISHGPSGRPFPHQRVNGCRARQGAVIRRNATWVFRQHPEQDLPS